MRNRPLPWSLGIIDNTETSMMPDYPRPPFPSQKKPMPGSTDAMQPRPDHGEKTRAPVG